MGPVFIVGCDRSGTTLLRIMLIQGGDLYIPHESKFLVSMRSESTAYGDFTQEFQRWFFIRDLEKHHATSKTTVFPIFGLSRQEAERAIANAAPTDFAGASASLFSASASKHNKLRWGDKTPLYVTDIPWCADAFPDAQFVHIIRDGRDVAASILKARWVKNIREGARYWQERVGMGHQAGIELGPDRYREIRYEDLLQDPRKSLMDLCAWLNLTYTEDMLQYYRTSKSQIPSEHFELFEQIDKPIDISRAYSWKRTMPHREIADFEDIAGNLLKNLGYETTATGIPLWVRGVRGIYSTLRPWLKRIWHACEKIG